MKYTLCRYLCCQRRGMCFFKGPYDLSSKLMYSLNKKKACLLAFKCVTARTGPSRCRAQCKT